MTRTFAWIAGGAGVLAVGFVGYTWWKGSRPAPEAPPPVVEAPTAKPPVETPRIEHPIQPPQAAAPPALDVSDGAISQSLAALFASGTLPDFVRPQNLVRNVVATVDNLPREKAAVRLMPVAPVPGPFGTMIVGENLAIGPDNAARYAAVMAVVQRVDAKQLAATYKRFYPLFQQAYVELGYPNGYFNDRLVVVIDHLLSTPNVKSPVEIVQPKIVYKFADPELEALSVGQKAMIRVGPDNAARIKAKLRELRAEIAASPPR